MIAKFDRKEIKIHSIFISRSFIRSPVVLLFGPALAKRVYTTYKTFKGIDVKVLICMIYRQNI